MLQGIYSVKFVSNGNTFGVGIVIFDKNKLKGGDATYLYEGEYNIDDGGQTITSTISVSHYQGSTESVVGSLKKFTLNATGQISNQGFTLESKVTDQPDKTMTITGKKLGQELIEWLQNRI